jgi:branched-chain amino acid transport system ATP-binding protein
MLEIEDLWVRYGGSPALRGISLRVDEGEAVGVIGPNGAGKTTLLSAITGLRRPSQGRLDFQGASLVGRKPEDIVARGIALVPEGRRVLATLTVGENLRVGASIRKDRAAAKADLDRMLERFPILSEYFSASAGGLSGGEQQQLVIARAVLSRPRVLLLDEPSLGLSPIMVGNVFEILKELKSDGVTILLVEQNAHQTVKFSDRTYALASGEVVAQGTREELSSADLGQLYLGSRLPGASE